MLTPKDIIAINEEFHTGKISNQASLDYALEMIQNSRNWLKSSALLMRAILVDHVFEEGNKRTAAAVVMTYAEIHGLYCNPDKLNSVIVRVIVKNITDIRTIERMIKHAIE